MEIFAALGIIALTALTMLFLPRTTVGIMAIIFIVKFASTYFGLNQNINTPLIGIILIAFIIVFTIAGCAIDCDNIKNGNYWTS